LSLLALLFGFILSQLGIYYSNRWGRRPRPDELLDGALKGMDKKYSLYHYSSPVNHLLIGPAGMWALFPYYQRGTIVYDKNRYKQRGGNLYLKIFAQEGLGRPELDVAAAKDSLQAFLKKRFPDEEFPPADALLVFTNPEVNLAIADDAEPPAPAVKLKDLKELIRKSAKSKPVSLEKIKLLEEALRPE
ncbi:MAG: hypothetical protein IT297_06760, partial [Anaerolineae bacterium]|nr:hypothetical protein [Anaerolineae bacterium]